MGNNSSIVSIIKKITEKESKPCKKTLQKMVYLIQEKSINLGYNYEIYLYGPYSSDLDFAVRELYDEGILDIEFTPTGHYVSIKDDSKLQEQNDEAVNKVIDNFVHESASDLELIATTLYVYKKTQDVSKTVKGVKKVKGSKYSEEQINDAMNKLKDMEYISPAFS